MKIGIAVTTHNRNEVAKKTLSILRAWIPKEATLVCVDDASITPFEFATYRFEKRLGVGFAKNKCLELLHDAGCTHFFLFDDDCYPLINNWYEFYLNSSLKHACYTFDRLVLNYSWNRYREFEKPCGCMLYFTREVINKVGGWDLDFNGYGYEHCNISDRIYNNGLTPGRYVDAWHEAPPFELADCESSFTYSDRAQIPNNLHLYQQKFYSKEFKPFK